MAIRVARSSWPAEDTTSSFRASGPDFAVAARDDGPTVASYFGAFSSVPSWDEMCNWPPDVFAFTNLVLDHTQAFRFAVAPPGGSRWPPEPGWDQQVVAAALEWRAACEQGMETPGAVRRHWDVITRFLDVPLAALRDGHQREIWEALLTLHAIADESCRGLATLGVPTAQGVFERRAWDLLDNHGSLSHISPARIKITPKTHFTSRGLTIRSFSRYLALNYESVELRWHRIETGSRPRRTFFDQRQFNLMLVPWPLEVESKAFRSIDGPLDNMDTRAFGFFEFDPEQSIDLNLLKQLIHSALRKVPRIDAVVLPEAAVDSQELASIEHLLSAFRVTSLMAGVRERASANRFGRNYVHFGIQTPSGWVRYQQDKHHRWCLDEPQIRQYHLSRMLKPSKQWWEAIDLTARTVQIIDVDSGITTVPLICEDLARLDEVADVLRRIGPSLVVALLLDGPQLAQRWPCRYATVLTDEPGSAVLTLTSFGMAARSRPPGKQRSRAVALWSDSTSGLRQLELERGNSGILIAASVGTKTVWTADGRRHDKNTPAIEISEIHQLRAPASVAGEEVVQAV